MTRRLSEQVRYFSFGVKRARRDALLRDQEEAAKETAAAKKQGWSKAAKKGTVACRHN